MNNRFYKQAAVLITWTAAFVLYGQAEGFLRKDANSPEIQVSKLTSSADGTLEYFTIGKSPIKVKLAPSEYLYAWIPKPQEIIQADSQLLNTPAEAVKTFTAMQEKYKYLGWDIYCKVYEAIALGRSGKLQEAISKLDRIREYRPLDLRNKVYLTEADRANVLFRIQLKDYAGARKILNMMASADDPSSAAFAFLHLGDLESVPDNAAAYYLRAAILFSQTPEAPEALYKIWKIYSEKKDPKAKNYADFLNKAYPDSSYTKLVK